MKKLVYILLVFLATTKLYAQDIDEIVIGDSTVLTSEEPITKPVKKLHTGVNVDMGYMFGGGVGTPFMSVSPLVTYPVTERFDLSAGISAGYGGLFTPYHTLESQPEMLPMTRLYLFASGSYKLNEKLTVTGSAYKGIIDVPNPNSSINPAADYNFQGASVGFNYKFSRNFSFGLQMNFDSPSMYNTFYNPYRGFRTTPYGW